MSNTWTPGPGERFVTNTTVRPVSGDLVCVEWGDTFGVIPADVWLWQAGNSWKATMHPEIATWWEGTSDEERLSLDCPDVWARHISDVPTTGTLDWCWTDDAEAAARRGMVALSHLSGLIDRSRPCTRPHSVVGSLS